MLTLLRKIEGRRPLVRLFSLIVIVLFTLLAYRKWRSSSVRGRPFLLFPELDKDKAVNAGARKRAAKIKPLDRPRESADSLMSKRANNDFVGFGDKAIRVPSGRLVTSNFHKKKHILKRKKPSTSKSRVKSRHKPTQASSLVSASANADAVLYSERPPPAFFEKSYLEIYTRFPFHKRWDEARTVILPSMQLFWPHAHIVFVMDQELPSDVQAARDVQKIVAREFPPLKVRGVTLPDHEMMLSVPGYGGWQRGQLDMMFADQIVKAKYVGLADSDTFITTLVAPNGVFTKDGRPKVVAGIGRNEQLWSQALLNVQFMLKKDYVVSCMSYFPVVLATAHIRKMREYVAKVHGKSFLEVYRDMFQQRNFYCHYSTMCNYIWHFHRDEYEWHYHNFGKDKPGWDRQLPGQTNDWSFLTAANRRPVARMAVHFCHTNLHSEYDMPYGEQMEPRGNVGHFFGYQKDLTEPYLVEGFCYVAAVQCRTPVECQKVTRACLAAGFDVKRLQKLMFRFEILQSWEWDRRCIDAQREYYDTLKTYRYWLPYAKKMLKNYNSQTFAKLNLDFL